MIQTSFFLKMVHFRWKFDVWVPNCYSNWIKQIFFTQNYLFFLKETCLSFIYWSFWRILTEFDHFHHFGTKSSTLFDYFSPRLTFLNHFDNFDLTIFLSFSVIFDHFKWIWTISFKLDPIDRFVQFLSTVSNSSPFWTIFDQLWLF